MAGNRGGHRRRLSSIDDGLSALLAELKQEDGGRSPSDGLVVLHGFTPLPKPGPLGPAAESLARQASVASTAFFPPAATHTLLKGNSLQATPLVMPISFVPVGMPGGQGGEGGSGLAIRGGKLRPGGGSMQLLPSGGSFSIPAYARPLTQLDFISTDDIEDEMFQIPGRRRGSSILSLLRGSGGSGLSTLGELGDERRLGELPTEDDLRAIFVDPLGPAQVGESSGSRAAAAAAAAAGGGWQPAHNGADPHPAIFFQQAGWMCSLQGHASAQATYRLASPAAAPAQQVQQVPAAAHEGAAAPGSSARRRGAGQAKLKRRVDRLDLEAQQEGSPLKRHSGEAAWSGSLGGSDSEGSSEEAPGSGALQGVHREPGQQLFAAGAGPAPSRFRQESCWRQRQQRPVRHTSDGDPSYAPREWEHERARQGPRPAKPQQPATMHRASGDGAEAREAPALQYRGVSRHRLTQRWEASLWLNGRQLYLGGFNSQEDAAHAYDLAALACKGMDAQVNFSPADYREQLAEIEGYSRDEVVAYVRRRSSAFSRGKSRFRGVSGHNGRWEARIGAFGGRKNVSFGVFDSEEGAARQYDRALILEKGRSAKTNFPTRDYEAEISAYERHLLAMCGATHGPATAGVAATYTLPTDREATADEKKRSAVIYAEALRAALRHD